MDESEFEREKREWMEWERTVHEGLVPKVEGSKIAVAVCPPADKLDAKFALELGVMVVLNKPILLVVSPDREISPKLKRVADKIIVGNIADPDDTERISQEIRDFADSHN